MTRNIYLTFLSWCICLIGAIGLYLLWDMGSLTDSFNQMILLKVRLPRIIEALLTGAILTLAGQMFQTVLNNPLADSFTLGLASGATFGSGLAIFLGLSLFGCPSFQLALV